jgi:vacuolar protein sorting-associated protein 13A/C
VLPEGFGYRWSNAIRYEDLLLRKTFTVKCPHSDEHESAFRFHAHVQVDPNDITLRSAPLPLRPPFALLLTALNGDQEKVSQDKP